MVGAPMKPATNRLAGVIVERARRPDLLQHAAAHRRDAVAHRHRLDLVVRDIDGGDAGQFLKPRDLGAHMAAQPRVEIRQRLVHQEGFGPPRDRAAHRDALPLAAGELAGLARQMLLEFQQLRGLRAPSLRYPPCATPRAERPNPMFSATVICG